MIQGRKSQYGTKMKKNMEIFLKFRIVMDTCHSSITQGTEP
jgi:hypothetical protein